MKIISFWCNHCEKDFEKMAREILEEDDKVRWFTEHPECRRMCYRYRDVASDPYYKRSKKIQYEARKYARDLIQPNHPDFDRLYPQHKKEKEQKLMEEERKHWEKEGSKSSADKKKLTL